MAVNIEWVGHACFRVWEEGGPVLVMDPYNPGTLKELGLFSGDGSTKADPDPKRLIDGDTVIVSSLTDQAHGFPRLVRGQSRVIDTLELVQKGESAEVYGSPLVAVGAAESSNRAADDPPKANALYAVRVGGLWIMHLGDLGYGLTAEQLKPFAGRCDVLLAIIGVKNTLTLDELDAMIGLLKPKWIVPMHYELPPFRAKMHRLAEFLKRHPELPLFIPHGSTVKIPTQIPAMNAPVIVSLTPSAFDPSVNDPFD